MTTCSSAVISAPVNVSCISDGMGPLEPVTWLHSTPSRAVVIGIRRSISLARSFNSAALFSASHFSAHSRSSPSVGISSRTALNRSSWV